MFQPARWKAYLKEVQSDDNNVSAGAVNGHKSILQIFHSQKLWFTREEMNNHQEDAEENLKKCDKALKDSDDIITALEDERRNKPKPSEMLDWSAPLW